MQVLLEAEPTLVLPTTSCELDLLIVEDDPAVQQILGITLEMAGYRATTAGTVAAALAALATSTFAAAVVDVHLPDGTGFEVLTYLREMQGSNLPVVMLSGVRQHALIENAMDRGANAYVIKPFSPSNLTEVMRQWTAN
jgi:DNA-binding response OmpR family regulator